MCLSLSSSSFLSAEDGGPALLVASCSPRRHLLFTCATGKKTYTLLMGKPSPAKLANFPEVGAFVLVSDPLGHILDCKDYYAPIVTPYEALLALTGQHLQPGRYRLDFGPVLDHAAAAGAAAAMAAAAGSRGSDSGAEQQQSGALVAHDLLQLSVSGSSRSDAGRSLVPAKNAAEYLALKRTYRGLEAPAVGAALKAVECAVEGRSGRAAGYSDEPSAARLSRDGV